MGGLVLDIYIAFAIRWLILLWRKRKSRKWPPVTGAARASSYVRSGGFGCAYADIPYEYAASGERYEGVLKKPFIDSQLGQAYVSYFSDGREVQIRVNPQNPSQSMLASL